MNSIAKLRFRGCLFGSSILVLSALSQLSQGADNQSLTRSITSLGGAQVQGVTDANNTQSWRAIPYAAPPVGELRWKAPRDPATWNGVRPSGQFASICPQLGSFFGAPDPATFGQPIGSEDCLYLNVWRPKSTESNLPVLFWIHGGSNLKGAGSELLYNGANFARNANAVVVTVNYRLGSLGWLYNSALQEGNAKDDSGNYVTLDLIKGLEWVRDNIAQFGGNPNSVTIAGQSAGCINAWGLLQSPLADSLVDRMICMSGLPNAYPKALGELQSNDMIDGLLVEKGYASDKLQAAAYRASQGPTWVRSFLRGLPAADIVRHTPTPVVMGHFTDGHVIPWAGYVDLIAGGYHKVPMILGTTKDEGTYFAGELLRYYKPSHAQMWDMVNNQNPASLAITDIVKPELYPTYRPVHRALSLGVDLTVDNICRYLRLLQGSIYRYNFDWDDSPAPWQEAFGAVHGMDLPFLFGNFPVAPQQDLLRFISTTANQGQRTALSAKFTQYTSQFMRTGNPNKAFDALPDWYDWSNFWIFQKRLILDNTVKTSSHDVWLSDMNNALNQLGTDDRQRVLDVMAGQQVQLEDADVSYE
ncbi:MULTISPECIES: carboxylesterase/lipase family protein [unclassified Pseudomonas]|uniref:carboxylesterase/lipase family protein n=1 Tax=unclassified Pseudomonas TaxID=196821 RepID=UPI00129E5844|nr:MULTISPECIES: carboxylesterase family protein [unclassified Pseudomonas]MDH4655035.1 carboxylesterase family protein [Pseudomonas sp. BN606]MRK20448.1 carboxylesterase family protein [Pseudomonas sp. JG-B]